MIASLRYELVYDPAAVNNLRTIEKKYHRLIRQRIEEQLQFEPTVETANRKPLDPPSFFGDWEIRFGPDNRFRVLYEVDESRHELHILAIGEKRGNRLFIGDEEVVL